MNLLIRPGRLSGTVTPPASKSQAHRALLAAALSEGESVIRGLRWSRDIRATADCLPALGASWSETAPGELHVSGSPGRGKERIGEMDCGESGSTLRFLIPIALSLRGGGVFRGHGRLMERPLTPYLEIFREKGISWSLAGDTLEVSGRLSPGAYRLPVNVSSQFITGLLLALPALPGDSRICLTTPPESAGYIRMTLETMKAFGVEALPAEDGWHIPGNQVWRPQCLTLEGDWSQAAFFVAAGLLGSSVAIKGMREDSAQGDRIILEYAGRLSGPDEAVLDVSDCPDLAPALAAAAALRSGRVTRIVGAGRLRIKESDRLAAVTDVLRALGADVSQ